MDFSMYKVTPNMFVVLLKSTPVEKYFHEFKLV